MGFPLKIRQEALRLSARHCSVCHRYRGVKMEVHHLKQEADGGKNTLENAIPLCFDCHSDAGHFNIRHPKGTKFSISELSKAREDWYLFVQDNSIPEKLIISEHIQTSYYILHSFDVLERIINNDFTSINKFRGKTYLSSNETSNHWKKILETHKVDYNRNIEQELIIKLRQFKSIEEYKLTYSNVSIIDKGSEEYPYFECSRDVNWKDLLKMNIPKSFLTLLSNSGVEAKEICKSLLHKNGKGCEGETKEGYTEYIKVAPISFVFLGITNASREQIKLNELKTSSNSLKLPAFNLLPFEMVLIPISTVVDITEIDNNSICLDHKHGERAEDLSRVLNNLNFNYEEVLFLFERIIPNSIIYNTNNGEYETDIHKLDFNNLYTVNSYWQCGSCPHLFFVTENELQIYSREILVECSNKIGYDTFFIPQNVKKVIIRELEDEITYLNEAYINDKLYLGNKKIEKGDSIIFDVKPGDKIKIVGKYVPFSKNVEKNNDLWKRNKIVEQSNSIYIRNKTSLQQHI
jgi:hypothetical protein